MLFEHDLVRDGKASYFFVFYDNWCPFCTRTMKFYKKWDWLNRITFLPCREDDLLRNFNIDKDAAIKRMISVKYKDRTGDRNHSLIWEQYEGIDTIYYMSLKIPILWIFVPLLYIVRLLGIGAVAYDWIARSRKIIPIGQCENDVCFISKDKLS